MDVVSSHIKNAAHNNILMHAWYSCWCQCVVWVEASAGRTDMSEMDDLAFLCGRPIKLILNFSGD